MIVVVMKTIKNQMSIDYDEDKDQLEEQKEETGKTTVN
jgi:hypothetical protein